MKFKRRIFKKKCFKSIYLRTDSKNNEVKTEEESSGEAVAYSEKIKFNQNVKSLTQEQLGKIVKVIQSESPEAFKSVDYRKF